MPRPAPGARLDGPHTDVTGGGPFGLLPGQVTDDTHLAICVAAALRDDGLDVDALIASMLDWRTHTFDIGTTTSAAIARLGRGERDAGRAVWEASGRAASANGSLMRTAPIGVRYANDATLRRDVAFADSALTHFDPRCMLACAAFDAAIAAGVAGADRASSMIDAASHELGLAATALRAREPALAAEILEAMTALRRDLRAATDDDPALVAREDEHLDLHDQAGFVRVAFRFAFWELAHAASYRDGVIDVVNRGGDADTNGAIAGALLGARHGASAIPAAWRARVLDCAPAEPWATRYHPRRLLTVAGTSARGAAPG